MPFIPHTENEVSQMLSEIGAKEIETLFDEIPASLRCEALLDIPDGLNELELSRLAKEKAEQIVSKKCFLGAGAYEHHIPACVWDIASRGEFLTAYTPYQAEASQGTLQLLYEYQTMMAKLTGLDVSNASLYDGASALAESILMSVRANKKSKSKRIILVGYLHPYYQQTVETIVKTQGIELVHADSNLSAFEQEDVTAVVVQQPDFLGQIEDVDKITQWAHAKNSFVIGVVNPISLALLKPPGEWGDNGADIACGEGQPLGVPLASGGPYFGFISCKQALVRQMPGRIIGRTQDLDGKEGFALTLQAREQHIRRSKATSNICTNQGLLVTAATIYMSLMGNEGLRAVATSCHLNTKQLLDKLTAIDGVDLLFDKPYFHEVAISLPVDSEQLIAFMQSKGYEPGLSLESYFPQLGSSLLICVTETKTMTDIDAYVACFKQALKEVK